MFSLVEAVQNSAAPRRNEHVPSAHDAPTGRPLLFFCTLDIAWWSRHRKIIKIAPHTGYSFLGLFRLSPPRCSQALPRASQDPDETAQETPKTPPRPLRDPTLTSLDTPGPPKESPKASQDCPGRAHRLSSDVFLYSFGYSCQFCVLQCLFCTQYCC